MLTKNRTHSSLRRLIAGFAFVSCVAAGLLLVPAADTDAAPSKMIFTYYFDSPARTNLVGVKLISCWHGTSTSGQVTPYTTQAEESCVF